MYFDLANQLRKDFDLICCIDLADLRLQHKTIFDIFKQYYQQEYLPNQRLVFYSSTEPEQAFLDHIQYAAARIDVSNFFILLVTPYDISAKLAVANSKHGHDDMCMQSLILPMPATKPFGKTAFADRTYLCPLPFMATNVVQDGAVFPCCKFKTAVGKLTNSSLDALFDSAEYQTVRQQMVNGQAPVECSSCWSSEQAGSTSLRQLAMSKYKDILDQQAVDQPQLLDLTFSPSTLCNFKCRICGPNSSSSIRSEELAHSRSPAETRFLKKAFPIYDDDHDDIVFSNLSPSLDSAEFVHLLGGEPLMWPKLPQVIEKLIDSGRCRSVQLEFNTNGSIYPDYLERLKSNFKKVEILISIDDVGQRFEIQRGGNWSSVFENLKKYSQINGDNFVVKLTTTINIQNVLYLNDVIELAKELNFEIMWWYVDQPKSMSIDAVTDALKQKINVLYHDHPVEELRKMNQRVQSSPSVSGKVFLNKMQTLDQRRGTDFFKTHPELGVLMSQ